ncbi:hypothetical protein Pfo_015267, partial [Paulownia fortunei]
VKVEANAFPAKIFMLSLYPPPSLLFLIIPFCCIPSLFSLHVYLYTIYTHKVGCLNPPFSPLFLSSFCSHLTLIKNLGRLPSSSELNI